MRVMNLLLPNFEGRGNAQFASPLVDKDQEVRNQTSIQLDVYGQLLHNDICIEAVYKFFL
jgi:hypothetical protein